MSPEASIISSNYMTLLCANCRKKIHCIAGSKDGEAPEMLKDRCNNKDCECRCRRYYIARNGRLKKYGVADDTSELEDFNDNDLPRTDLDDMLDEWRQKNHD